eukprot:g8782.t1
MLNTTHEIRPAGGGPRSVSFGPKASFTLMDLQRQEDRILLAVWGRVFDVSSGKEFYGEGQSYQLFAGHDCSKAFALTLRQEGLLDQGQGSSVWVEGHVKTDLKMIASSCCTGRRGHVLPSRGRRT